jgi:polysaccharide export outer membrane protein
MTESKSFFRPRVVLDRATAWRNFMARYHELTLLLPVLLLGFPAAAQQVEGAETPVEVIAQSPENPGTLEAAVSEPAPEPVSTAILGPGDMLSVSVLALEEIKATQTRIDGTGHIDLLLVGRIRAAGLTTEELKEEIARRLGDIMNDPQVVVSIEERRSQPIQVIGSVNKPGVVQLEGRKNLVEVLSLAGGIRQDAGYSVKITRQLEHGRVPLETAQDDPTGRFSVAEVDMTAVMEGRNPAQNIEVRPHDVVSVPRAKMVYVVGGVSRPGAFAFGERQQVSVLQAVSMANGLDDTAAASNARILRTSAGLESKTEVPVNLKAILAGKADDVAMQPDDILFVPDSKLRTFGRAAVENAVRLATGVAVWRVGRSR